MIFKKGQVDFLYGNSDSRVEAEAKKADKKQRKQRLATRMFIPPASMARICIKMTLISADRHCHYRGRYNQLFFLHYGSQANPLMTSRFHPDEHRFIATSRGLGLN